MPVSLTLPRETPTQDIQPTSKRILWTETEEAILKKEVRQFFSPLSTNWLKAAGNQFISFQDILDKNKASFHPSRTAKSLEAHFLSYEKNCTILRLRR